jgi:hypothetical protein
MLPNQAHVSDPVQSYLSGIFVCFEVACRLC